MPQCAALFQSFGRHVFLMEAGRKAILSMELSAYKAVMPLSASTLSDGVAATSIPSMSLHDDLEVETAAAHIDMRSHHCGSAFSASPRPSWRMVSCEAPVELAQWPS